MTWLLFGTLFALMICGVPIAYSLMIASLAALAYLGEDLRVVGWEMSRAMANFFPFIAVPLFILSGEIMNKGGLSRRIVDFFVTLVGHRRGGMGMVTVLATMLFGGISGASSADTAAIGSIMIPAMHRSGYPLPYATALAACAGPAGGVIPPSIMMIICGAITGLSIEKLFLGGAIPGMLIGLGLMVVTYFYARRHQLPVVPRSSFRQVLRSSIAASPAIALVAIILGGILGGLFTATEASAVAVVYALVVGLVVLRELRIKDLSAILVATARTTGNLSFLMCSAVLFARLLTLGDVPQSMATGLLGLSDSILSPLAHILDSGSYEIAHRVVLLLAINAVLLGVGMFLDAGPALLILIPVLMPLAEQIQMDKIHFAVMAVVNLTIGVVTPPVGTTLFVACSISKVRLAEVIPPLARLLLVLIAVQLLITFVPPATTWLPTVLGTG